LRLIRGCAAFGGLIVALLIGFMVMMKESECGSYRQDVAVKNWRLIYKEWPWPYDGD
jgi:hypothetical protein